MAEEEEEDSETALEEDQTSELHWLEDDDGAVQASADVEVHCWSAAAEVQS